MPKKGHTPHKHRDSLEDPGDVDSLLGEKYITDIELKLHLIHLNIYCLGKCNFQIDPNI